MTHRIVVAAVLSSALILGPAHADPHATLAPIDPGVDAFRSVLIQNPSAARAAPPHRAMAQMLCGMGIIAMQRLAFHSPDPRIGFAYKAAEIEVIAGALAAVADHSQAPVEVKRTVFTHLKAIYAHLPTVPMSQLKLNDVLDWQKATLAGFKAMLADLKS